MPNRYWANQIRGLQGALKFALSAADVSRDGRDGVTAQSEGQASEPDAVSLPDQKKADPSTARENVRLHSVGINGADIQSAPRATTDDGKRSGNEAQRGREPVAVENEIPVEEPKLQDRKLDGGATTRHGAAPLELGGEMSTEDVASNTSRRMIEPESLAPDADDQLDSGNVSEPNDDVVVVPSNAIGLLSQSTNASSQVSASLQKAAGQSVPAGEPGATSATSNRSERNVRLVSEAAAAGRLASDRSASLAFSAMPELRARLATETATAERSLNLDDQALEMENNIEADALNRPVRVVKQEGHLAVRTGCPGWTDTRIWSVGAKPCINRWFAETRTRVEASRNPGQHLSCAGTAQSSPSSASTKRIGGPCSAYRVAW